MTRNQASTLCRNAANVSLGALLERSFTVFANRIALRDGGRSVTYRELDARSARLCGLLAAHGIGRGDRFAILSENRAEYIELLVAAARIGAVACCQNWRLTPAELSHCIRLVEPRLIVASPRYADQAAACRGLAGALLIFGADFEKALARARDNRPDLRTDPEDGVVILYTSGTTGLPKGALISQRAEIARATVMGLDIPSGADDAFVAWAPLFHMVSTDPSFAALLRGATVIVTDGFDPGGLAAIVAAERLGHLILMPGMIAPFMEALRSTGRPPAGIRWAGVMADLVPRQQLREVTSLLRAPYMNTFGSTETGSPPASAGHIGIGEDGAPLDKTQSALCDIRLVDEADNPVPDGESGELAIRSPTLFSGYWNNPEATATDFRGGWFLMGDMFRRNPDGTLTFVDRKKYLIKSGGENIYPAEIEQLLLGLPQVADAVVVRQPDAKWGEVPVAFIVRREGSLTAQDVTRACADRIAGYKRPKRIIFVEDAALPRSATGKIMRHLLEDAIASGRFDE